MMTTGPAEGSRAALEPRRSHSSSYLTRCRCVSRSFIKQYLNASNAGEVETLKAELEKTKAELEQANKEIADLKVRRCPLLRPVGSGLSGVGRG